MEEWLPIHAAAINGHLPIIELLLKHNYPPGVLTTFQDAVNEWEYELPFDINMQDRTGQNVLYLACVLGNFKLVDMLLKFRVTARRIKVSRSTGCPWGPNWVSPPPYPKEEHP